MRLLWCNTEDTLFEKKTYKQCMHQQFFKTPSMRTLVLILSSIHNGENWDTLSSIISRPPGKSDKCMREKPNWDDNRKYNEPILCWSIKTWIAIWVFVDKNRNKKTQTNKWLIVHIKPYFIQQNSVSLCYPCIQFYILSAQVFHRYSNKHIFRCTQLVRALHNMAKNRG